MGARKIVRGKSIEESISKVSPQFCLRGRGWPPLHILTAEMGMASNTVDTNPLATHLGTEYE
jgi:hypothetical protein